MGGANGSRECAPDDKLRDTHRLHFMELMAFARAQPILRPESFIGALQLCVYAKTDGIDSKTGSGDLPVGRFVDRGVESFFRIFRKIFLAT